MSVGEFQFLFELELTKGCVLCVQVLLSIPI
jgi:hypothetical protein